MKKKACGILILLFTLASLFAARGGDWALSSLKLGLGNDKYTYGISRNDDDQLSYSEHIMLSGEKWYVKANLNGITNRGWRTGWDISDDDVADTDLGHFRHGRLDVTEVMAGYNWTHEFSSLFSMKLSPETGFFLSGYTGYDFFQNTVHKILSIHTVSLPYDYTGVRFHPYLGGNATGFFSLFDLDSSSFGIAAETDAYHAWGFETSLNASVTAAVIRDYRKILSFELGWKRVWEHNESYSMDLYSRYVTGPYLGFTIDTGFFCVNYFAELENHFGYAVLSFDVMSLILPSTWKESRFFLSMGFSRMTGLQFQEQQLRCPIDGKWSVVLKNRYVAGRPVDAKAELLEKPEENIRLKQDHAMTTIGLSYSCPVGKTEDWVSVYASCGIGFMKWNITALLNMNTIFPYPSMSFSPVEGNRGGKDYSFVADIEAGVTVIPEGLVTFNACSLSVSVFAGLSYVTGSFVSDYRYYAVNRTLIREDENRSWTDSFLPRWGLMFDFGFDI